MGCDIHCFVEKKIDGKWEQITGFVSDYYDPNNDYFSSDRFKNADSPIYGRNYTLFALLADVRNGYGFAGIDTGDRITPISSPKGLPDDVSEHIRTESDSWDCDGHSHSWLTVKEILDYNIEVTQTKRGYVTESEFIEYIKKGEPSVWSGGVSGRDVVIISQDEMMKRVKAKDSKGDDTDKHNTTKKHYYCQIQWTKPLKQALFSFFNNSLPQLIDRCDSESKDDVRIVFWFDN